MRAGLIGQMRGPNAGNRIEPHVPTGLDNGCFSEQWNERRWWRWLQSCDRSDVLFAVAPDVMAQPAATLERFASWAPRIRAAGFPVAFVGQDGIEGLSVPWDQLDCWFAGGTTTWKLSVAADELARKARDRGKWAHLGRVNSRRRYLAKAHLYDSCDGTMIAFAPDANLPKVLAWSEMLRNQPSLFDRIGA